MKVSAWMGSVTVALAACGSAALPAPQIIAVGQGFVLAMGESVRIDARPGQALELGFERVVSDSRCPRGEQCVHAGQARVRVWLQQPGLARQPLELVHRPGAQAQAVPWPGQNLEILLLDLRPAPAAGAPVAPTVYEASLAVREASASTALE